MNWSKYQLAVFNEVKTTSNNIVVSATAGSGKSTTLVEIAKIIASGMEYRKRKDLKSLFLAFNKSIQLELQDRLPNGFESRTLNSFGFSFLRMVNKWWKVDPRKYLTLSQAIVARIYRNQERNEQYKISLTIAKAVDMVRNANIDINDLDSFWQMCFDYNLDEIVDNDIALIKSILIAGEYLASDRKEYPQDNYARLIIQDVKNNSPKRWIDYIDQIYLPLKWGLIKPSFDIMLIDETQDLNALQLEMVLQALNHTGRGIFVGDASQCQPEGTKVHITGGGLKNIEDLKIGDEVVSYSRESGCFVGRRNQGRKIENISKRKYSGEIYTVTCAGKKTKATGNHKWLVRFSDKKDLNKNVVYLMRQGNKYRVGWCQLFIPNGCNHLAQRTKIEDADESWILSVHDSKAEATVQESYVSARFGIPTSMFSAANGANLYTQENLDLIFSRLIEDIDLKMRAKECLDFFGRNMNYPFFSRKNRKRQGRTTLFITETYNLLDDIMSISTYDGQRGANWNTISVKKEKYDGYVYSLKVETHELYVADGLLTHNSIYGFAGADHNSIGNIIERTNAKVMPLSITYRCPKSHVGLAKQIDPSIEASPNAKDGEVKTIESYQLVNELMPHYQNREQTLLISRVNTPLIKYAFLLLGNRIPAKVKGRDIGTNIINIIKKIANKKSFSFDNFLPDVYNWYENEYKKMKQKKAKESQLETLKDKYETIIALYDGIDPYNIDHFCSEIENLFTEENGVIMLSTVHKAKGLEAENVFILAPEKLPLVWKDQKENDYIQEMNIKFVALTRSKDKLVFVNEPKENE